MVETAREFFRRVSPMRRGASWAAALAIYLALAGSAGAYTITSGPPSGGNPGGLPTLIISGLLEGDSVPFAWVYAPAGLDVSGTVTITDLTSTQTTITISLLNNSTETSNGDPRVTSFGLSIDDQGPLSLADTDTGGTFLDLASMTNFAGFAAVDVCATSGANCAGGGTGGIEVGNSDTFSLVVNGSFGTTPALTLDSFAAKFQGGPGGQSFEIPGAVVPEPGSLLLLGTGLIGVGAWARRRFTDRRLAVS